VVVSDGHGESVIFFHNDHLGSVSLLSDGQGNLIADSLARYLPFGEWRTEPTTSDPSGSPLTDHGFTGQKHNMDIGLYYYNARFYAPAVGRFISADVIVPDPTNPQQFNRYTYSLNNPVRFTDSTGHFSEDAIKAYLVQEYGNLWESIFNAWKADAEWWNMLLYARAGDVLVATGRQSTYGWRSLFYTFLGEGNDLLTGIARTDAAGNPFSDQDHYKRETHYYNNARLNDIFSGQASFSFFSEWAGRVVTDRVHYAWGNVLTWDAGVSSLVDG
jgi:RHS repeat-associated protein